MCFFNQSYINIKKSACKAPILYVDEKIKKLTIISVELCRALPPHVGKFRSRIAFRPALRARRASEFTVCSVAYFHSAEHPTRHAPTAYHAFSSCPHPLLTRHGSSGGYNAFTALRRRA